MTEGIFIFPLSFHLSSFCDLLVRYTSFQKVIISRMKEEFKYENHLEEIKFNLEVGTKSLELVFGGIYKTMKPTIEYAIRDALDPRLRKKT
jgi:hypothetical protein